MKSFLVCALLILLDVAGRCNNHHTPAPEISIVGTWYSEAFCVDEEKFYELVTFNSDGTGTYQFFTFEGSEPSHTFTYAYTDDTIVIKEGKKTYSLTVVLLTQSKLTVKEDSEDKVLTFNKK